MKTGIKICGLTREEDVDAAVAAGADAIGFVFYPPSPRYLTPQRAAELARRVPPFVAIVGNDACWNAESQIQLRDYGAQRMHGCALLPTRYDQVVTALGGYGEMIDDVAVLPAAIERAIASGKPACVNIMIESIASPIIR